MTTRRTKRPARARVRSVERLAARGAPKPRVGDADGSMDRPEGIEPGTMRAWATEQAVAVYLAAVEDLRSRAHAGGLTPELRARLRAVMLAAHGAKVPPRAAVQAMAVEIVRRWLPEIRGDVRLVRHMLRELRDTIGGDDGARFGGVPVDAATIAALGKPREAVGAVAWLMVRSGALMAVHRPIAPNARGQLPPKKLEDTVEKIRKAIRDVRRTPLPHRSTAED